MNWKIISTPLFPGEFALSLSPRLRSLHLELDLLSSRSSCGILSWKNFLIFEKLSTQCTICDISITISSNVLRLDDIGYMFRPDDGWRSFDEGITSSRFPFPKKLSLTFNLDHTPSLSCSPTSDNMSARLSRQILKSIHISPPPIPFCLPSISSG